MVVPTPIIAGDSIFSPASANGSCLPAHDSCRISRKRWWARGVVLDRIRAGSCGKQDAVSAWEVYRDLQEQETAACRMEERKQRAENTVVDVWVREEKWSTKETVRRDPAYNKRFRQDVSGLLNSTQQPRAFILDVSHAIDL